MAPAHGWRIQKEIFWWPSFLGCMTLFAAATTAEETKVYDAPNVPSSHAAAVSADMPKDGNMHLPLFATFDLALGQSVGGLESSVSRAREKQQQISQLLAIRSGLVAVVCLAVAFFVLQCTRKVVFPRLFGSLGRRALSDSELEDKWLDECSDEEEEGWVDEGDEGGGSDEIPAAETGEPVALQTLQELRGLMTLGVETTSCLRVEYRGFMLLLLLTISTQELALYGIHSTPEVEVERQRTLDFIVEKGRRALAELDVCDQSSNAASKAEGMLKILEEFRTPRPGSNAGELAVQAKLSEYRISQCRDSLQQLQHWVQNSLPIPEAVSKRALRIVISTRIAGKSKIMGHMNTKSWVEELQRQHNFFEIIEPRPQGTRLTPRTSFRKEIRRVEKSYTRLARLLAEDVRAALNQQPAELRLKDQHQQGKHRQQQDRQSLQPQHHQLTQQTAVNIAGTGSVLRPAEEPANLGNFVGVMSSHASRYPPHARHRPMRTRMPSWLRPPMRQSTQPPRHDPRQHSPPTHPERWYLPHWYDRPSWRMPQQATSVHHQISVNYYTVAPALRESAPVLRPSGTMQTDAQQHVSATSSGARFASRMISQSRGHRSSSRPADPSTAVQSYFDIPRPPTLPTQHQSGYPQMMPPESPTTPRSRASPRHPHRAPLPLPGHSFTIRRPFPPTGGARAPTPRPPAQRPTSHIPGRALPPPQQISGGWQQIRVLQSEAPATSRQPLDRGSQGATSKDFSLSEEDLNPVLRLIQDAFPSGETGWRGAAEPREQGGEGWLRVPPPHPPPSSGDGSAVDDNGRAMPTENQGSSASSGVSPQTQGGAAWSPWREDQGDSGKQ